MRSKLAALGLIAILLLAGTPSSAFRSEAPPWIITDHQVIHEESFVYRRPTTIMPGASLTISESVLDLRIMRPCPPDIRTPTGCTPDIFVLPGGQLNILESTLYVSDDQGLGGPLLSAAGGTIVVRESHLSGLNGIVVQTHGRLEYKENVATQWVGGIGFWRDATGFVTESVFHDQGRGVDARDASPLIQDNEFDNLGIGMLVQQSAAGDKVHTSAPTVTGNRFTNSNWGIIAMSGMGPTITNNHFENLYEAVVVSFPTNHLFINYDQPAVVNGNQFVDNVIDINVTSLPSPVPRFGLTANVMSNTFDNSCRNIVAWPGAGAPFRVDARQSTFNSLATGAHCMSLVPNGASITV